VINTQRLESLLIEDGIVFLTYGGFLTQSLIVGMTEALERESEHAELSMKQSNNIFTIFIELSQNMMNYSKKVTRVENNFDPKGMIIVGKNAQEEYYILSQNIISLEDREKIEPKLEAIQNTDLAGIAAAVYGPSGGIMEMNRPSFHPFKSLKQSIKTLRYGRMGFHIPDTCYDQLEPTRIQASSFVGCFVRCSSIQNSLGLPRKELFIYGDDILYTLNIEKLGLTHLFVPTIRFTHDCETLATNSKKYTPLWKAYYTYRNGIELYRSTAGWLFPLVMTAKILTWTKNAYLYEDKIKYLSITYRAILHGLKRDFRQSHKKLLEKYK